MIEIRASHVRLEIDAPQGIRIFRTEFGGRDARTCDTERRPGE